MSRSGAVISNGVGIGDSLAAASAAYPGLECGTKNASVHNQADFPYCSGKVATCRHIWFGQDPIKSVTLTTRSMVGLDFPDCKADPKNEECTGVCGGWT